MLALPQFLLLSYNPKKEQISPFVGYKKVQLINSNAR